MQKIISIFNNTLTKDVATYKKEVISNLENLMTENFQFDDFREELFKNIKYLTPIIYTYNSRRWFDPIILTELKRYDDVAFLDILSSFLKKHYHLESEVDFGETPYLRIFI
jgi:hypothetical protein